MTCSEFDIVAGSLLEGESHPEALSHLTACPRCRVLVEELAAVERTARMLPFVEPSDRLWARLEKTAIQEGLWSRPAWWQWSGPLWNLVPARPAFAGVLGLTLGLAVGLMSYFTADVSTAQSAPVSPYEVAQGEMVQEAGYSARYDVHLQNVQRSVLVEGAPEDSQLRELTAGPLSDVDRAIEQTQARLADDPDDALARDELHRLYRQKATVLQAMSDPAWQEGTR